MANSPLRLQAVLQQEVKGHYTRCSTFACGPVSGSVQVLQCLSHSGAVQVFPVPCRRRGKYERHVPCHRLWAVVL